MKKRKKQVAEATEQPNLQTSIPELKAFMADNHELATGVGDRGPFVAAELHDELSAVLQKHGTSRPNAGTGGEQIDGPTVTVPVVWQSDPKHPPTMLAYITPQEAEILSNMDLHGSGVRTKRHHGPGGLPSFNGNGSTGDGYGGGGDAGNSGGNGGEGQGQGQDGYADSGDTDDGQGGGNRGDYGGEGQGQGQDGYADAGDTDDGQGGGNRGNYGGEGYADSGDTDDGQGGGNRGNYSVDTTTAPAEAPVPVTTDPFEGMFAPPGPPVMPSYAEEAGVLGRTGDRIAAHFQDMAARPAETAINTAFGLVAGPLGQVNAVSGLFGGPTVGSVSVSAVNSLGVSTPGVSTGPQGNDYAAAEGNSGGTDPVSVQAREAATGQVATTIDGSTNRQQGTITRETATRRRAFSRLSLGGTARTTASVLW